MSLTVGIATKDASWCLPYCLDSLINQTTQPNEYIICVGSSIDDTEKIVYNFKKNVDIPTNIIYDKDNYGTGFARKSIVENAKGNYIVWIDSDDILPSNWIETLFMIIEQYKFSVLRVNKNNYDNITLNKFLENGAKPPEDITNKSLTLTTDKIKNILAFKRVLFLEIGNYDSFFVRGQDEDMLIRIKKLDIDYISCKELKSYHLGLKGQYSKMFSRSTFFRFLYKYGFRYATLGKVHTEHTISFLLRSSVVFSFLGYLLSVFINLPGTILLISLLVSISIIYIGLTISYSRIPGGIHPSLYIIQLGKCFGEYLTLIKILSNKRERKFGYGLDIIKNGCQEAKTYG